MSKIKLYMALETGGAALQSIDHMPQSSFDEIIEKYVEMRAMPITGRKSLFHSVRYRICFL